MKQSAGIVLVFLVIAVVLAFKSKGGAAESFSQMRFDASDITVMDIRDTNNSIELVPSSDGAVHITYFDSEERHYEIDASNGKLSMVYHSRRPWYMFWNWPADHPVTIEVPAETLTSLSAKSTNGQVRVSGLEIRGDVQLATTNNQIVANKVAVGGRFEVATVNGAIDLANVKAAGGLSATGTNGATQISGIEALGEVVLKRTNGSIDVRDTTAKTLETHNTNGNTSLSAVAAKESILLSSTNGKITGEVSGQMSDYRITSHTVNGKNNLPSHSDSGDRILKVTTTNGRIDISFSGASY